MTDESSVGIWNRLSVDEFKQLQEYTRYSKKKLKDVLRQFRDGLYPQYDPEKPMEYSGFKLFMSVYLGDDVNDELCQTLFWTFHKKIPITEEQLSNLPPSLLDKFIADDNNMSNDNVNAKHGGGDSTLSRIAKGAKKATILAAATAVPTLSADRNSTILSEIQDGPIFYQPANSKSNSPVAAGKSGSHLSLTKNSKINHSEKRGSVVDDGRSNSRTLRYIPMVSIREVACYLSLLEGGDVEDKLEFVFRVYDSDGNEELDQMELESIVQQMVTVAEYLGWDTTALKPIFSDMLAELDFDSDGSISLDEWLKGGMNNIPLLVLLGMNSDKQTGASIQSNFELNVIDERIPPVTCFLSSFQRVDEEGKHQWQMKHFKGPAYCNICHSVLSGFTKRQGLHCSFCRYTVHEGCVGRAPASCIQTYTTQKSKKHHAMVHHWTEGNTPGKCDKCSKTIKSSCLTGLRCAWCQTMIHNKCVPHFPSECNFGQLKDHILPPTCIAPQTMEKQQSIIEGRKKKHSVLSYDGIPMQITPLPGTHPLVVFVNPKSGGRQGTRLLEKFQYLLNPRQVFNLIEGGPMPGLKFFSSVPNFRVLCCGGDGTVGWVLSSIDRLTTLVQRPPVAILPLGTGNDLSRCLSWGGGYEGGSLQKVLEKMQHSSIVMLDRWELELSDVDTEEKCDAMPLSIMNNYFSIGVDASIALKFHLSREKNPEKFNSRLKNKLRYFEAGTAEQLASSCKRLHDDIEVICDDVPLDLKSGPTLEGIIILNIPSMYGGTNLWGETETKKRRRSNSTPSNSLSSTSSASSAKSKDHSCSIQAIGDKLIEVVGVGNSIYVGQCIAGLRQHGLRLAQCSKLVIKTRRLLPMQVDGEPWLQGPATMSITHKNQTPMLRPPVRHRRKILGIKFGRHSSQESKSDKS